MALKDRFRRAIGGSDRSPSNSSSSTSNQTSGPTTRRTSTNTNLTTFPTTDTSAPLPAITLTKTSSRLGRILTGEGRQERKREKEARKLDDWKRKDEEEWVEPKTKYPGRKSAKHQEMLRAFEWRLRSSFDGRRSTYSGISPGASRNVSVDEGAMPTMNRVLSSGSGRRRSSHSQMERVVSRGDSHAGLAAHTAVETVAEE